MAKLTFADVVDKEFTIYEVSRGGSISKREKCKFGFDYEFNRKDAEGPAKLTQSALHINKNGNIHIGWGYAIFLNKEDAQALALKIAKTKYENSVKKIMNI
jgi:hypothetical protein